MTTTATPTTEVDPPRRRRRAAALASLLGLLLTAGCGTRPEPASAEVPMASPSPSIPRPEAPTAVLPDGHTLHLELAITPDEVANGLMFRPSLAPDRGMLFLFPAARVPAFWMKNTLIPLDLVFLDGTGKVVDLIEDVQPCPAEPCPQYVPDHPVRAVLEIGAGVAASHHLAVGDIIRFSNVEGYPIEEPAS